MSSIANIENKESGESVRGKLNNAIGKINNLGSAANVDTGTVQGSVPVLIANGKLPDSTIPSLAISRTYEVADDAARDALDGVQEGDVAIVEASAEADGLSASYIWTGTEWVKLRFPKDPAIHDQNTDTKLAEGTSDETSASELRAHVDDAGKHREIDDAGTAATDLWSADKIGTDLGGKVDTEEGKGLSDENYTLDEKNKLSGLESSKFLGQYASLSALNTAHPDPATGSYAYVDEGVDSDVVKYIWDDSDNAFVLQLGEAAEETPASIKQKYEENADTNVFTNSEQTKLTGIEAGAEVNQTDAEIKTQYEKNDDTNAFTDNEQTKLSELDDTTIKGIVTKEAAFNLEAGDAGKLIRVNVGIETDCTIRENATHAIPVNSVFTITQIGDGAVNLVGGGATTINAFGDAKTAGKFAGIKLIKVDTDEWDAFSL